MIVEPFLGSAVMRIETQGDARSSLCPGLACLGPLAHEAGMPATWWPISESNVADATAGLVSGRRALTPWRTKTHLPGPRPGFGSTREGGI
jgi:hypothetical protein